MATELGTAYIKIMPSAKGISGSIADAFGDEGSSSGTSVAGKFVTAFKGVVAAAGIGTVLKESLEAGADLQQSFGGLETIYGDAADAAKAYAQEAAKAGISANDYAEQAVSFGASLRQAFGDDATGAVEAANTAIMDMTDNAAKMGTPIENIQNAYQGFAKQNYTMLDNLKLGYGGTKQEMERLLADAEKIHLETTGEATHYDINNLGDVYAAIHDVQENLGLTGVAAQEASETFSGSLGSIKASLTNLLANLSLGEDIGPSLDGLMESVGNFLTNNLLPMVGNILSQLPELLGKALIWAFENIPNMIDSVITFINNLATDLTNSDSAVREALRTIGQKALEMFKNIDWKGLGIAVLKLLVAGLKLIGSLLWEAIKGIGHTAVEKFKGIDWLGLGKEVITAILGGITSIGSTIWEGIKGIGESAKEKFDGIDWNGLGSGVIDKLHSGIDTVGSKISTGLQTLGTAAHDAFGNIKWMSLGSDVINKIISGITSITSNILSKIREITDNIKKSFTGQNWLSVGVDIISGIVKGVLNAASTLINTLTGLAKNAWQSAKNFLGIKSPSKLFETTVGAMIPPGMAKGIEDKGYVVSDAINDVATDAIDKFEVPLNMSNSISGSGAAGMTDNSQYTINVYANDGMNVRDLAQKVSDELARVQRQRQAVWGYAV